MKILYICGDLSLIGGIEKYNKDFIESLSALDDLELSVIQRYRGGFLAKFYFLSRSITRLIVMQPDIVICAHLHFSIIGLMAKYLLRINYSISLYGIECIKVKSKVYSFAIKKAKTLTVISEYTKKLITNQFILNEKVFYYLPSCVNEYEFSLIESKEMLRKKFGMDGGPVLLTLSRLSSDEEKGQHRVLRALPYLSKKFPTLKYVIAGPGNDPRVDGVINLNPNIKDRVIRLGKVSTLEKLYLYNLCDLFVLLSKNEGFGIVFLEALACGSKVVASDGYGCKQALFNGELGLTVDPDDDFAVALTLEEGLLSSLEKGSQTRAAIRSRTIEAYGSNVWRQNINALVNRWVTA